MSRQVLTLASLGWMALASMSAQTPLVRTFDAEPPGNAPEGFQLVATRQAAPGIWRIKAEPPGHALVHQADALDQQGFGVAVATAATYADLVASVRLKHTTGDRVGGLVWRYQDEQNYYAVSLDLTRQEIAMYRVVSGNRIRVEREDDLELDPAAWHTVKVVHEGSTARIYLGGIRVFTVRDRTFERGQAGLWATSGSTTMFDDFRLRVEERHRK